MYLWTALADEMFQIQRSVNRQIHSLTRVLVLKMDGNTKHDVLRDSEYSNERWVTSVPFVCSIGTLSRIF